MHNIKTNFDKIIGVVKDIIGDEINEKGNYLRRGTLPKFSDIEVIAMRSDSRLFKHCIHLSGNFWWANIYRSDNSQKLAE
jgi:hypothetical protein